MTNTIGNKADITFLNTNKTIQGKIDTGATTSCLNATDIQAKGSQVTFSCPELSSNMITMDTEGGQQVRTADGGVSDRPTVKLDIRINGVDVHGALFNLNDRGEMDCPVLIGQNVLKAGNFVVDVNKDSIQENIELELPTQTQIEPPAVEDTSQADQIIKEAIQTLIQHNVSLADILRIASE